jgi:spermidine/putrescine transport system ATP-binding protein
MKKKLIELHHVKKAFGDLVVLDDFNLYINENEFVTLLGPSGCGKTTCLRLIGGFETPDEGSIVFDGKTINDLEPNKREINTCFQRYALFPHLNVFENVAFGLRIRKVPKDELEERVMATLRLVKLEDYATRTISTLSGGQQQRVAIARAIVNRPKVLLLDEPLGALDLKLRQEMQYELKEMQRQLGITFIYVTHDQEEALTMSDTVVIMNEGKILQIGTPEDIYNEPNNRFVANFIGESNIFDGTMLDDYLVRFCGRDFKCVDRGFKRGEAVDVVIRPEDFDFVPPSKAKIVGVVDSLLFKGVHYEINVIVDHHEYTIHTTKYRDVGDKVGLMVEPANIHVMRKQAPRA